MEIENAFAKGFLSAASRNILLPEAEEIAALYQKEAADKRVIWARKLLKNKGFTRYASQWQINWSALHTLL